MSVSKHRNLQEKICSMGLRPMKCSVCGYYTLWPEKEAVRNSVSRLDKSQICSLCGIDEALLELKR